MIQSGFETEIKRHWLGDDFDLPGPGGNDIRKTNVPDIRLAYRYQTLEEELQLIYSAATPRVSPQVTGTTNRSRSNVVAAAAMQNIGRHGSRVPGAGVVPGLAATTYRKKSLACSSASGV